MDKKIILLREILEKSDITQRGLAHAAGLSLGSVNTLIKNLKEEGLIACSHVSSGGPEEKGSGMSKVRLKLTEEGLKRLSPYRVDAAVIMAAGFGTRFVPISFEIPKGLVEVFGEPMIEREIRQLHEAGVTDIAIVVGYMKEKFEYLTDKFGVSLIYNPDYETKNNISSIYAARDFIRDKNIYILSSDHWMRNNIFHTYEAGSWYAAKHFDEPTDEWVLVTDKKGRITETYPGGRDCDCMYGPAYFSREFSSAFMPVLEIMYFMPGTGDYFWENVLMDILDGNAAKRIAGYYGSVPEIERLSTASEGRTSAGIRLCAGLDMNINLQPDDNIYEIESLEELRSFDPRYMEDSGSEAMRVVSRVFGVPESEIVRIRRLKAGMTNNSWLFSAGGGSYICRVPGKGTELLIDRKEEKAAYDAVHGLGITENVIYFDADEGYKISEYYEGSRTADPESDPDMSACMRKLRQLHQSGVSVAHEFDIGKKIAFYEELCGGIGNIPFTDYGDIAERKDRLLKFLNGLRRPRVLAHIDSVHDNFLFLSGSDTADGGRDPGRIRLIDWEYAGMCDPLIDIAMCAIYSFRSASGAAKLLKFYLGREASAGELRIVYAYMALGGLLWALWGVYKETLGVNFTDYTIRMYRYFKEYSLKALSPGD